MTSQCSIALLESALAGNLPADDESLAAPPPGRVRGVQRRDWSKWQAEQLGARKPRRC